MFNAEHFEQAMRKPQRYAWLKEHGWKIALYLAACIWAYLHQL